MKKETAIILAILFFISCDKKELQQKNVKEISKPVSPSKSYLDDYNNLDKIKNLTTRMNSGDTISYKKLMHIYFYSGHVNEFLYNAMSMAEKFDYPLAYFDTYTILYSDEKQSRVNKLANYYLFVAYEKKSEHADSTIKERFGESFIVPKSKDYWNEINR